MLVLSRKQDESVILETLEGVSIEVKILYITKRSVKIGFAAPRDVVITRGELLPSFNPQEGMNGDG